MESKSEWQDFRKLEVWKKARQLRNACFRISNKFLKEENYRLKDQIVRASRSITANIAEGHGRFHYQENIQYCRMARGSLAEVIDHLMCALDCEYIDNKEFMEIEKIAKEVERILNGYLKYLHKKKNNLKS